MMTKRGPEDFSTFGNGSSLAQDTTSGDNHEIDHLYHYNTDESMADLGGTKKLKLDEAGNSSTVNGAGGRVVHIRNIPVDTSPADLQILANQFGRMTKHLLVKSKGQAFIEFESATSANHMANFWLQTTTAGVPSTLQPTIRGRHVHCQLSNHKELKATTKEDANGHQINGVVDHITGKGYQEEGGLGGVGVGADASSYNTTKVDPSPVIRVVIENMIYSVTIELLHQLFSRCGVVQKIILFTKNNSFQALVQFDDVQAAIKARAMSGQNLFQGANLLRIDYSKLLNLNVKYQNEKSRDFTLLTPASTGGVMGAPVMTAGGNAANGASGHYNNGGGDDPFNLYGQAAAALRGGAYGNVAALQALQSAASLANGGLLPPAPLPLAQMSGVGGVGGVPISPVILVSGLAPEMTPDALFTLFGVYGDVLRVKILFNKKDTALIQMAEPSGALLATNHLDKIRLYGRNIRVMSSKHQHVQMPKDGHQDSGLTKDFQNSPLHRFKRPGSKNYNNIYPPSETLHVSNIPSTLTEEDLKQAFSKETGKEIVKFKFFPNDRKMALVQYESVGDAIIALIAMHNYKLCSLPTMSGTVGQERVGEHSHLRVSFSKSPV